MIEPLESRISPASLVSLVAGNVTVLGDQGGQGENETLIVSLSGTVLQIADPAHPITAGPGFTQSGQNSVSILLSALTGDFVIDTGTGADTLNWNSALNLPGRATFTTGAVTFNQGLTLGANQDLVVNASGTINLATSNADLATSGAGTISLTTRQGIQMSAATGWSVTTVNGDITLSANQQSVPTAGDFYGIQMSKGSVQATGSGNITMNGKGGVGGFSFAGVAADPDTIVRTNTGSITLTGIGARNGGPANDGVQVNQGSLVESTGGGSITFDGSPSVGSSGFGIRVLAGGIVRTTGAGNITLTGTGGLGQGPTNFGVAIDSAGAVTSSGSGSITIDATGGANAVALFISDFSVPAGLNRLGFDGTNPYSGAITINADGATLSNHRISTTAGVSVLGKTPGQAIALGVTGALGNLVLTDAELDGITAGNLQIGDANSGAIIVNADLTHANNLTLSSGVGVSGAAALTLAAGRNLAVSAAGPIDLSGPLTVSGTTTLAAGIADISVDNAANAFSLVRILSADTASVSGDSGFTIESSNVSTRLTLASAGAITQSGAIAGTGGLTKTGAGTLTLSSGNTYTGATLVAGGILALGNPRAFGVPGAGTSGITVENGAGLDLNGITPDTTVDLNLNGAVSTTEGALTNRSANAAAYVGTVNLASAASIGGNAGSISLGGTSSGAFTFTKVGSGTVILTGDTSGMSSVTISAGTLELAGGTGQASLPLGTGVVTNNSILTFNRVGQITVNNVITGSGVINKDNVGEVFLAGDNTYAGQTNVKAGTLILGSPTALGTTAGRTVVAGGATLDLNGQAIGAEGLSLQGIGNQAPSPQSALANSSATAASFAGRVTLTGAATIGSDGTGGITLSNVVDGPFALTKDGTNTLILGNALNSFGPAPLTISRGTVQVASDGALGDGANPVILGTGVLHSTASFVTKRPITFNNGLEPALRIDAGTTLTLLGTRSGTGIQNTFGGGTLVTTLVFAGGSTTATPGAPTVVGNTTVTVTGAGQAIVHTVLGDPTKIDTIELVNTTSRSNLVIKGPATGTITINRIINLDPNDPMGSIVLGPGVILGDGVNDSVPEIEIAGKVSKLQLGQINSYALVSLGKGLPYNAAGNKTADTYNHRPSLKIDKVLGPGVVINVTADVFSTPPGTGTGGGGLGKVVVKEWAFPGSIRTTQSIASFKLLNGDCLVDFQVDKFHVGTLTQAGVGSMSTPNGSWGSSGSEIEGAVGSFNAQGFLQGALLTAGSMGKLKLGAGGFAGTIRLTDPDSPALGTFVVASDFTGSLVSAAAVKKLSVRGDFTGSLEAALIGGITAFSFEGVSTLGPGDVPQPASIKATAGSLGTLTATAGGVSDFSIVTDQVFKGFNIKLSKLTGAGDVVGIDNVQIQAVSIGKISVSLTAAATGAAGLNLIGIRDSDFVATGTGPTTPGSIGNISVNLAGGSAASSGIEDSDFWASGSIGTVAVKSKTLSLGTIEGSHFLAGQSANLTALKDAALGAVTATGSVTDTQFIAGGAIGAVTVGGSMTGSLLLAGGFLGADHVLGGVGDSFQRAASIAAITVKGAFATTSIAAGINPGNAIFGDGDDTVAAVGPVAGTSFIGPITLSAGTLATPSGGFTFGHAIEAAALKGLKLGATTAPAIAPGSPSFLDQVTVGEDAADVIVRIIG